MSAPVSKAKSATVPSGWRHVVLADVCGILNGFAFDGARFSQERGMPLIRIRDLKTNTPSEHYDGEFDEQYLVPPGAFLIGMDGEFRCYKWSGPFALLNQRLCRLLPNERAVHGDFLYLALNDHLKRIEDQTSYTTVKHISSKQIAAIEIALPPLSEQKRFASALREQLDAAARMRAAAEAQAQSADHVFATRLALVFDSPEVREWPIETLGNAGEVVSGVTLGRKLNGQATRPVAYLRVANVKDGHLDLAEVYTVEATEAEIAKLRLLRGDLLLTEGGDPDKLGRGTVWAEQVKECIHQNHIFRLRLDRTRFVPEFVSFQLGSRYGKAYFARHAKQTTGIATINQRVLRGFPLKVPPLIVQRRVADELHRAQAVDASLRDSLRQQGHLSDALQKAVLRRAFSGGL